MITETFSRRPYLPVLALLVIGAIAGVTSLLSPVLVIVGTLGVAAVAMLIRTPDVGAVFVGAYWLAFAVKSTVFSQANIAGLFFPFYGALLLAVAIALLRHGLRVNPTLFWLMYTFLSVVAISFIGFDRPIDSQVTQKLMALLVSVLVLLNVRSPIGVTKVPWFVGIGGLTIAFWVIFNSIQGGFQYRGDVDTNENVAAFILGACFIVVLALFFYDGYKRLFLSRVGLILSAGVMAYGLLLLASRGMSIAAVAAVAFMFIHLIRWHRASIRLFLVIFGIVTVGLLLPGGGGLLLRFGGESVDTAGDRLPIWTATVEATVGSNLYELLLGHGFNKSQVLIRDATAVHTSTHNAYLAISYEYGLFGLLAFLGVHLAVLLIALRSRTVYGTLAAGLIGFLLAANMTSTATDDFMYWLVLGFAMACASFAEPQGRTSNARELHYEAGIGV